MSAFNVHTLLRFVYQNINPAQQKCEKPKSPAMGLLKPGPLATSGNLLGGYK